jgi:hypothetical protein
MKHRRQVKLRSEKEPQAILEIRKRIRDTGQQIQRAISNHDFEKRDFFPPQSEKIGKRSTGFVRNRDTKKRATS